MIQPITDYITLVFDCDGVILRSNHVKTNAFYRAGLPYGEAAAQALVDHHVTHGGVSRYKKFAHFLAEIAPAYAPSTVGPDLDTLLQQYADEVSQGLLTCEVSHGLPVLRQKTIKARWLVVSGGDQAELREVFAKRGIAKWFDGGIFGSPDTKEEILAREISKGNIQQPALFLGDSKYDYQVASNAGLDFIFLSDWTDLINWNGWVKNSRICSANSVLDI